VNSTERDTPFREKMFEIFRHLKIEPMLIITLEKNDFLELKKTT